MKPSSFSTRTSYEVDKDAAQDFIHDGHLSAPRSILKGRRREVPSQLPAVPIDEDTLSFYLQKNLETAMGPITGLQRAVMFSGGFDSMLVACLARNCGAQVTVMTVQFEEFNRLTVAKSIELAQTLGFVHRILPVKAVEFLSAFETLATLTEEPIFDLDLSVVYAALKKYDTAIAGKVLISGMGSDQWFGHDDLKARSTDIIARLGHQIVSEEAHQKIAQLYGLKFVFPFLSKPMLALSQSVPLALKKDKKLLRALTVANMIPSQGAKNEIQVPLLMRNVLIKTYGDRAWPSPVSSSSKNTDETLRKIILGLWLEKVKHRKSKE